MDKLSQERLQELITTGLERVEETLGDQLRDTSPAIAPITSHLAQAGGKRMRPALTLLVAQLGQPGQVANTQVVQAATAVEMTHLATLYHDDVMDDAMYRRGVLTAHQKYENSLAVLAGDLIFAKASLLVAGLGPEAVANHSRTFARLCEGQMHDILGIAGANAGSAAAGYDRNDPIGFYLQVLADKTGSLVGCAAQYGAELSGCNAEVVAAVTEYGERLGVAFQVADDVLDLRSDRAVSGKTPGIDLREGTKTLPVLLLEQMVARADTGKDVAAQDSAGQDLAFERQLLADLAGDLSTDEALDSVVTRLRDHAVVDQTVQLARQWVDRAITSLDALPDSVTKDALIQFARQQADRLA